MGSTVAAPKPGQRHVAGQGGDVAQERGRGALQGAAPAKHRLPIVGTAGPASKNRKVSIRASRINS